MLRFSKVNLFYDTTRKFRVRDAISLREHLGTQRKHHYVYVLCYPPAAKLVRPFYVGVGQGQRLFSHERQSENISDIAKKLEIIRSIESSGQEVLRYLDGVFSESPWRREQELIEQYGLLKDGSGILANEQKYAPSTMIEGVELRKYAEDGNELPDNFIRRDARLVIGQRKPRSPSSVYGKIYAVLDKNPGATGAELVEFLLHVDFSDNDTVYAQTGQVSRPWLAKYIDGGFYKKNRYIQERVANS